MALSNEEILIRARARSKIYRDNNKEKERARHLKYRTENKEILSVKKQIYYEENRINTISLKMLRYGKCLFFCLERLL